jgi:hypothetical protein
VNGEALEPWPRAKALEDGCGRRGGYLDRRRTSSADT